MDVVEHHSLVPPFILPPLFHRFHSGLIVASICRVWCKHHVKWKHFSPPKSLKSSFGPCLRFLPTIPGGHNSRINRSHLRGGVKILKGGEYLSLRKWPTGVQNCNALLNSSCAPHSFGVIPLIKYQGFLKEFLGPIFFRQLQIRKFWPPHNAFDNSSPILS